MDATVIGQIVLALIVLATALANRRKVDHVHDLVDSKLTAAL